MRAGVYVRVSGNAQRRYGTSLETQETECRAAAEAAGFSVSEEHIWRETYSGRTLDRPQLNKMLEAVRHRALDTVWVHRWDRLARNGLQMVQIPHGVCGVRSRAPLRPRGLDAGNEGGVDRVYRGMGR